MVTTTAAAITYITLCLAMSWCGWLLYTFVEYWVHRGMHAFRIKGHLVHHMDVEVKNSLPFDAMVLGLLLILLGAVGSLGEEWSWLLFGPVGFGYGYYCFRRLHTFIHKADSQCLAGFTEEYLHHSIHHNVDTECNYGVVTTNWDRVFGTLTTAEE